MVSVGRLIEKVGEFIEIVGVEYGGDLADDLDLLTCLFVLEGLCSEMVEGFFERTRFERNVKKIMGDLGLRLSGKLL